MTTAQAHAPPFWHAALLHDGDDELVEVADAYVREGLDLGEAVAVALPTVQLELVRKSLSDVADEVLFVDITELGRNPARVLPEMAAFQRVQARHRRMRAFGSPFWPGRSEPELRACREHDALMNLAFTGAPVSVLCPFDRRLTDPELLEWVRTAHPLVCEHGRCEPSPDYGDQQVVAAAAAGPLAETGDVGETLLFQAPGGPRTVRLAVAEHGRRHGLGDAELADLCLAVHEVAVNTVVHTAGTGILTLWTEDDAVICQVEDRGWIADPLVGRHPPDPADGRGYGLFLAHQLCDLVEVHSDPADGTTVRLWMRPRAVVDDD